MKMGEDKQSDCNPYKYVIFWTCHLKTLPKTEPGTFYTRYENEETHGKKYDRGKFPQTDFMFCISAAAWQLIPAALQSGGLLRISCSYDACESQKVFCPQWYTDCESMNGFLTFWPWHHKIRATRLSRHPVALSMNNLKLHCITSCSFYLLQSIYLPIGLSSCFFLSVVLLSLL